jgi:hypothetical protein
MVYAVTFTLYINLTFQGFNGEGEINLNKDSRAISLLWQSVSYTITSSEMYHRDQLLPFFGSEVSTRHASTMTYLVRAASLGVDHTDFHYVCI